jgi:hypothetical protein
MVHAHWSYHGEQSEGGRCTTHHVPGIAGLVCGVDVHRVMSIKLLSRSAAVADGSYCDYTLP